MATTAKRRVVDDDDHDDLAIQARDTLKEFFKNKARTSADIATARIASGVLSSYARTRQAAGAADALNFMIARELSSDRAELERFLVAAMPHVPIVRALPKPS